MFLFYLFRSCQLLCDRRIKDFSFPLGILAVHAPVHLPRLVLGNETWQHSDWSENTLGEQEFKQLASLTLIIQELVDCHLIRLNEQY